jgi:hypothetical protein
VKVICSGKDKSWCEPNLCTGNIPHERETRSIHVGYVGKSSGPFCTEWEDCVNSDGSKHKVRCVKVRE